MPKIRSSRTKRAPEGFDEIEPTLKEFQQKMKDGKFILPLCSPVPSLPGAVVKRQFHVEGLFQQISNHHFPCELIAENDPHEGKRKVEALWPVFRIHHQRSRYVYELFYKRKAISKELYEYLLKQGYADGNLIAKWKKVRSPPIDLFVYYGEFCCVVIAVGSATCPLTFMSLIVFAYDYVC